ncbi:RNA-directed DNA polymerase, eukaryota [Tanacetum coccineum]
MYKIDRSSEEYLTNLFEFIRVAEDDRKKKGKLRISCPCQDCYNILTYIDSDEIKGHLISTGLVERYTCWSWHGELLPEHDTVDSDRSEDDDNDSHVSGHENLDDMLHDLEGDIDEDNHAKFQELFVDMKKPLYAKGNDEV